MVASPLGSGLPRSTKRSTAGFAAGQSLLDDPADQRALGGYLQAKHFRDRHADVGIADRRFVDITGLEAGSDRRHEIHGVGAAEAAVHALSLLQAGIGDITAHITGLSQPVA